MVAACLPALRLVQRRLERLWALEVRGPPGAGAHPSRSVVLLWGQAAALLVMAWGLWVVPPWVLVVVQRAAGPDGRGIARAAEAAATAAILMLPGALMVALAVAAAGARLGVGGGALPPLDPRLAARQMAATHSGVVRVFD